MKQIYIFLLLFVAAFSAQAQETLNERVFVHLDKACYVAGEDMWVKFFVTDSQFRPSSFSKVGYVEICDTERPQLQLKLALEEGQGSGKIAIPLTIPSGTYELSGYTRYMRNESTPVVFKRQIAIINLAKPSEKDRLKLADPEEALYTPAPPSSGVRVKTDKQQYTNRQQVTLSLEGIPANATDLVVSVSRNDSIASLPAVDTEAWLRQVPVTTPITNWRWQPEYEGHIILGRTTAPAFVNGQPAYHAGIGFVGNDIHYIHGRLDKDGTTLFYTNEVYGPQEVVTSVASVDTNTYRMDIVSPFEEVLPTSLPALQVHAEDPLLMDRFIGAQLKQVMGVDSLGQKVPLDSYYYFKKPTVYDLDEYTRFSTLQETIIEFILHLVVRKIDGKKHIRVLIPSENRFSTGNTLLLLDGVPIRNHEHMLSYNPRNIRYIQIYDGKYYFGGELFECLVSFVSHRENLSAIQLDEGSQLVAYDCPSLPTEFSSPEYPDAASRQSLKPDFRHTLYWNPCIGQLPQPATLSFYTSDLCGEFKVTIEGFTRDGQAIHGTTLFRVTP